jgi:hypothetical protein
MRVGSPGTSSIASAKSLTSVTLSSLATATAAITLPVTATGTATLLGSIQATATVALNAPITASINAEFNKVQLPKLVPILKQNQITSVEVVSCGLYFTSTPSVFVSEPDIFDRKFVNVNISSNGSFGEAVFTQDEGDTWPGIVGGSLYYSAFGTSTVGPELNAFIISKYGLNAGFTNGQSLDLSNIIFSGTVTVIINNFDGNSNVQGYVTYRKPSLKAELSSEISDGRLSVNISNNGNNYSNQPDIFVIPSPDDYTLGEYKSVSSARISGRTAVVTCSSHGISAGSLIYVESLDYYDSNSQLKSFGVKGVWPVVSVTTDSLTFRIDKYACLPSKTLYLSISDAKIYPVTLTRRLSSCSVACSGSGFAPQTSIPFQISSDSCGGKTASGTVEISNAGQLASITIASVGSGFTSTSTVITIAPYKKISSVSVVCSGAGYWSTTPSVSIDNYAFVSTAPGATPAVIESSLNNDGTIFLSIINQGYGYLSTPSVIIDQPNLGNGIKSVSLVTAGVGYSDGTSACSVSDPSAGGSKAIVNFVKNGSTQEFVVVNPGRGYNSTPSITVKAPDLGGQISQITVVCGGAGYDLLTVPTVTISGGGGSDAAAEATVENGSVTKIQLTSSGKKFTSTPSVLIGNPTSYVFYTKQINLNQQTVVSYLSGSSSQNAYLQIDEKTGSDTTVVAQIPVIIQARIN